MVRYRNFLMMRPFATAWEHLPFLLRIGACALLLFLPLYFPHSPWKPEETRVVGILMKYLHHEAVSGASIPSTNRIFWGVILAYETWMPSHLPLEVLARAVSIVALILGSGALYGWARAMHRRYPNMIPSAICSGAPLLVASSLGVMVRGYQATPESVWFTGVATVLWAGAETNRLRRGILLVISALWLGACGGAAGVLLAVMCGGAIPWLFRWKAGARSPQDRIEGGVISLSAVLIGIMSGVSSLDWMTWLAVGAYLREISRVLVWYALPAWPLALAVWWRGLKLPERIRTEWKAWRWEPIAQCFVALLVGIKIGSMRWQESHVLMYLPFFIAMALPALYLVDVRSWFNAVHWFTRSVLILLLLAVWGAVSALHWKMPLYVYQRLEAYQPGFDPGSIRISAWILSMVLTCYALRYLVVPCRTLRDSLWRWTLGFGCTACVIRLMLVPYIDYGRSYQSVMQRLSTAIPTDAKCVELMPSVGAPQRAMWRYYTGRSAKLKNCPWRIMQGTPGMQRDDVEWLRQASRQNPGGTWQKVIQASRPGDRGESFFLMHNTSDL